MSLDTLVNVNISVEATAPTRANFGVPMLFAYHTEWLEYSREYASLDELEDDGFTATSGVQSGPHPVWAMAKALLSQNPHPVTFKVGRRTNAYTQSFTLTIKDNTEGLVYDFSIGETNITYTVLAAETTTTVATAIELLIEAIPGLTASSIGAVITVTADTPGDLYNVDLKDMLRDDHLDFNDITADPSLEADLSNLRTYDPDWYAIALDSNSPAEIEALASWIETERKIAVVPIMQSDVADQADMSNIALTLVNAAYTRILPLYKRADAFEYPAVAWMAGELTKDPGSSNWAFKTLTGVRVDKLLSAEFNTLHDRAVSTYTRIGGRNITTFAKTPAGEYIDIPRFIDLLHARIQEAVFNVLVSNDMVPYTDDGVEMIVAAVRAVLQSNTSTKREPNKGLKPGWVVTAPLVKDIDIADRANRLLPDVKFTAELTGAINQIVITGKITV